MFYAGPFPPVFECTPDQLFSKTSVSLEAEMCVNIFVSQMIGGDKEALGAKCTDGVNKLLV